MSRSIGLGAAVGVAVAAIAWYGNHSAGLVSILPDGLTFAALILLLTAVNGLERRRVRLTTLPYTWRSGLTIAAAAGMTFGGGLVLLGLRRFTDPSFALLFGTFAMGWVVALGCGWCATALSHPRGRVT